MKGGGGGGGGGDGERGLADLSCIVTLQLDHWRILVHLNTWDSISNSPHAAPVPALVSQLAGWMDNTPPNRWKGWMVDGEWWMNG